MQLTLNKNEILPALAKAVGASASGAHMAGSVLECVLLWARRDMLSITGTDNEVSIIATAPCSASVDGGFCVPAKKLLAVVKSFPSGEFTMSVSGNSVRVSCGRSSVLLPILGAEQFPSPDPVTTVAVKMPVTDLANALAFVRPAMAKQDVRYYINGVHLDVADGRMTVVATDGHRMGVSTLSMSGEWSLILPRRAVEELLTMLSGESVDVWVDKRMFCAQCGNMTLISKQIDGKYPDWRRVVPEKADAVSLSGGALRSALERAAIVAISGGVRLGVADGRIGIHSGDGNEVVDDSIDADTGGKHLEIGAYIAYVIDALKVANNDEVEIEMTNSDTAIVIRASGDDQRFTVVMPMRL